PLSLTDPTGMLPGDGPCDVSSADCQGLGIDIGYSPGACDDCGELDPASSPASATNANPPAGDPDPDGPFSGPIWQEGGPQIAPTGNLAALLGLQMPSPFIIDNWTTDQNGNVIGRKPGEQLCDTGGINCQNLYW